MTMQRNHDHYAARTLSGFIVALVVALLLAGCGFHLRGSAQLPPELSPLYLLDASPATAIAADLRHALRQQGVVLATDPVQAAATLQLHSETFQQRVLAVDTAGKAQVYRLHYGLHFSVRRADNRLWLAPETLLLSRDLRFDATAVSALAAEQTQLRTDMRQAAVARLLRRLQYLTSTEIQENGHEPTP